MKKITVGSCALFIALVGYGCSPQKEEPPATPVAVSSSSAAKTPHEQEIQRYGYAYKALMVEFRDQMQALARQYPLPDEPPKNADKETVRTYRKHLYSVSRVVLMKMADATNSYIPRFSGLHPPAELREFHEANLAMFRASAEANRYSARAVAPGLKKEERKRLLQASDRAQAEQLKATEQMASALKKAGGVAPPSVLELIQEMKAGSGS